MLSVAACLSEILRILAPRTPYDDNTMIEILHLIVDNFQSLDDFSGDPFGKRFTVLKNFTNVQIGNLLLDLELQDLIHDIFHHFLVTIKEYHDNSIICKLGLGEYSTSPKILTRQNPEEKSTKTQKKLGNLERKKN